MGFGFMFCKKKKKNSGTGVDSGAKAAWFYMPSLPLTRLKAL